LTLARFGYGQPAQPDTRHITRQFFRFSRRKRFRFYLADVEREKAENGLWRASVLIHQDKSTRDSPFGVLPRCLLEKQIERFTPAVESVPVVRLRQRFDFMHAP